MERSPIVWRTVAVLVVLGVATATLVGEPSVAAQAERQARCDPIDPTACLLPFPNDLFTVADRGTATGRRVDLRPEFMPRNRQGFPIDPAEWNRNDGFSPGSALLAMVPGLDLDRSGAARVTDLGQSLRPDAPIVLLDTGTGQRQAHFAELDSRATDSQRRALIVHPARNLTPGHHYVVALRNLRDGSGAPIGPGPAFAAMLGGRPPPDPGLKARWLSLRPVLSRLAAGGVGTDGLYLAWDFTVASSSSLTGRALHMRDDAFGRLGDHAPAVRITAVDEVPVERDTAVLRYVDGVVEVPSYLDGTGAPGARLRYGPDGDPRAEGVHAARFRCVVPRAALRSPAKPLLYGHGLFGNETRIDRIRELAGEHGMLACGTSWLGMAEEDVPFLVTASRNLSIFPSVPDRMQQAYVDALFLGRAMIHPAGLAALPELRAPDGRPLLDPAAGLGYLGQSLGGIQGTALTALAQDFTRAVLVVPATNFSLMLNRAAPFQQFMPSFDFWYPDKLDQQLAWQLMQMLWDRGEGNGYLGHLTGDPLPGTPKHEVLLQMAFGDHQVPNVATELTARTIGLPVVRPALEPGRSTDVTPQWDLRDAPPLPFAGSALVVWDSGSPPPPTGNLQPRVGPDPHGAINITPAGRAQEAEFLRTGRVVDVCAGNPCRALAEP